MKLASTIRNRTLIVQIIALVFIASPNVFGQTCTPSSPVCVPANGYAFQFAGDTDFGLLFNSTQNEYQFTNGAGIGIVNINAINGLMTVENNLLVKGKMGIGAGNPLFADFSVNNALSQFGVASGYAQFDPDGDLTFNGTANFLVGGDKYAFRYSGDEDFGLYFSLSGFAYDFLGDNGVSLFSIGSLNGNISNAGTATIGDIAQNDNLDRILVTDSTGLIQYRDAATLGGGGGGGPETDPQVGANTLNKVPKWDGSALVTGTISMQSTTASGTDASAMGNTTQASGSSSTAMGFGTSAGSTASTAAGFMTTSSGWASTSLGQLTTATGDMSVASGDNTTATAFSSTASGQNSLATGDISSAHGIGSKSRSYGEYVIGSYNNDYTPLSTNSWNSADRLFVIGNGANSGAASNALTVLKNGNIGLGIDVPVQKLHIASNNLLLSGSTTSLAGIEIQPKLGTANSGGRIFFREFNSDNFGMSMGYNGANTDNAYFNWPANSFNIAFHTDNSVGDIALSIPRSSGYVGINTTAPTTELDVDGSVRIRSLAGTGVRQVFADSSGRLINNEVIGSQVNNPNSAIPDNSCSGLTDTLVLLGFPDTVQSSDIRVVVNVTHTWLSDLRLYLTAPSGEVICLINNNGSNGDNLVNTIFSDDGQALSSGAPPFSGYYIPNGAIGNNCSATSTISSFSAIGGGSTNPNGEWILHAFDNALNTSGILKDWQIFVAGSSSGRNNYMIKWQDGNLSQQSSIYDNGNVGIGTEAPTTALEVDGSSSVTDVPAAIKASGPNGPTRGYLGAQGWNSFDGISGLNIAGREVGVMGLSLGTSTTDNYGVYGYSNGWGGQFEHQVSGLRVDLAGPINSIEAEGPVVITHDGIGFTQQSQDQTIQLGFYAGPFGAWLQTHTNHDLKFSTNDGFQQAVLTTSGNFGIGSGIPSNKLSVQGDADVSGNLSLGVSTASNRLTVSGDANITGELGIGVTSPSHRLHVSGNGLLSGSLAIGNIGFTDKLSVNGNIGIRKATSNNQVIGDLRFSHSSFTNSWAGIRAWQENGSDQVALSFHTAYGTSNSAMYIDEFGNVGINEGFPTRELDINGDLRVRGKIYDDLNLEFFEVWNNGTNGVNIKPNLSNYGTIGNGSNYWDDGWISEFWYDVLTDFSDRRVKNNIETVENAMESIKKLRGVQFDINTLTHPFYKNPKPDELEMANGRMGFIAQELKEVFPNMVKFDEQTGYYTVVNYHQLLAVIVEAIKEQQTMFDDFEAKLTTKGSLSPDITELQKTVSKLEGLVGNLQIELKSKDETIHQIQNQLNQIDVSLDECCANYQSEEIFINSDKASLGQNIPNPFDQSTIIPYYIPEQSNSALIVITTMDGKEINRYAIESFGLGKVSFNAADLSADSYMYSLFVDGEIIDSRIMIIQ